MQCYQRRHTPSRMDPSEMTLCDPKTWSEWGAAMNHTGPRSDGFVQRLQDLRYDPVTFVSDTRKFHSGQWDALIKGDLRGYKQQVQHLGWILWPSNEGDPPPEPEPHRQHSADPVTSSPALHFQEGNLHRQQEIRRSSSTVQAQLEPRQNRFQTLIRSQKSQRFSVSSQFP